MPTYNFPNLGIKSKEISPYSLEDAVIGIIGHNKITIQMVQKILDIRLDIHVNIRELYRIIRNLRDMGCPIVGDGKGIWIAQTKDEIEAFAEKLERKAKADIGSMLKLRRTMLKMIDSSTPSLFDNLIQ